MIPMTINFDGKWDDLKDEAIHYADTPLKVIVLDKGMASGRPSVAFRIDLPDGTSVIAETSARLFCTAANAVTAKYPDLFEGD